LLDFQLDEIQNSFESRDYFRELTFIITSGDLQDIFGFFLIILRC